MVIVTLDQLPGRDFEVLGMVKGSTVHSKNIAKDIGAGFKTLVGGEIKAYTEMMNEARAIATDRMAEEARILGADGILGVRFHSSSVMQGAAEIIVYGTAVRFR